MSKKNEFLSLDLLSAYDEHKKNIAKILLKDITQNPDQPRVFGKEDVSDLTESMKRLGLIEPIVVRKDKNQFIIVAGERRFSAATQLGWEEITAVITDANADLCYEMALAENEKRKSLNPWEVGKAIQFLRKEKKKTAEEVGKILGYTERYIKQLSSIARLDQKSVGDLIKSGIDPSVKNLENLLKKKEGRGEIVSPRNFTSNKISIDIKLLNPKIKELFMKDLENLLKKYKLGQ